MSNKNKTTVYTRCYAIEAHKPTRECGELTRWFLAKEGRPTCYPDHGRLFDTADDAKAVLRTLTITDREFPRVVHITLSVTIEVVK